MRGAAPSTPQIFEGPGSGVGSLTVQSMSLSPATPSIVYAPEGLWYRAR